MVQTYLYRILWIAGLALAQVLILNKINIGGLATPFIYIYVLLKFDSETHRNERMLWGFLLGMLVDVFSDTPGMNASATVLMAFLQPSVLHLFVPRDTLDNLKPSLRTMGVEAFLKYLFVCVLLHHAWLLALEFFSAAHLGTLLLRILLSSLLTTACLMAMEGVRKDNKLLT